MSTKHTQNWANKTPAERLEHKMKVMKGRARNGTMVPNNREGASWKAAWREIGGQRKYFRSRWEANYARYLEWMRGLGKVTSWEHEPETFWFDGIKRGAVSYLPDFRVVFPDGRVEYHEVKGWMDARSKTKIKRMKKYHPTTKLVVIDSKGYRALARAVSGLIVGWE